MSLGPYLVKVQNHYFPVIIGGSLISLGMLFTSLSWSLIAFEFYYGIMFGAGIGIAYLIPLILCWEHFPERKGMISGIIMCAFGSGAFLYGYLIWEILNPEGESPTIVTTGGMVFD